MRRSVSVDRNVREISLRKCFFPLRNHNEEVLNVNLEGEAGDYVLSTPPWYFRSWKKIRCTVPDSADVLQMVPFIWMMEKISKDQTEGSS